MKIGRKGAADMEITFLQQGGGCAVPNRGRPILACGGPLAARGGVEGGRMPRLAAPAILPRGVLQLRNTFFLRFSHCRSNIFHIGLTQRTA